jgi:putative peptide zinc metalloprotease protein
MATNLPQDPAPQVVPWRRREDIVARPQSQGRGGWVLKDPVALRYFAVREEEYFVWSRLNGAAAAEALCQSFGERFAPQKLSFAELQRFIAQLIGQGLVVAETLGSGAATAQRRGVQSRWRRLAGLNPLAIRFRGVDPDRWLNALLPWCAGFFSPVGVALGLALIASALVLWAAHAAEFARRWPEEVAQWTVADVWAFAAVLIFVKVLHELGHALTCKRYGGEVHEIGVLLLVFTPCLYCNVTDSWLLPSKWQRMAVGAAGMWVESVLAAACAWVWWLSEPGWLHSASLQVVLICAVSTLVFNINPLLRYDGYFILSDWLDVPNLQQQAWSEFKRRVTGWLTGIRTPAPQGLSRRMQFWLPLYAAASLVYRVMMVCLILWFLYHWLEPQGLGRIAQGISVLTIGVMLAAPIAQLRRPRARGQDAPRLGIVGWARMTLLLVLMASLLFVPLPRRVDAPLLLQPASAQGVYVTVDGALSWIAPPGTLVAAGEELGRLSNPTLEREIARLEGELAEAIVRVTNLERRRLHDATAALQLPAAQQTLADASEQLEQRRAESARLSLVAPQSGTLWPVNSRIDITSAGQLGSWSDSPFDPHNAGCWLTAGDLIGQVGRERQFEAIAFLAQRDVPAVAPGQKVCLQLAATPGRRIAGELLDVSALQTGELSATSAARLKLPSVSGPTGTRLIGTWYQARIRLPDQFVPPLSHAGGRAAIVVPPRSFAQRMAQWWQETFPGVRLGALAEWRFAME